MRAAWMRFSVPRMLVFIKSEGEVMERSTWDSAARLKMQVGFFRVFRVACKRDGSVMSRRWSWAREVVGMFWREPA